MNTIALLASCQELLQITRSEPVPQNQLVEGTLPGNQVLKFLLNYMKVSNE